MMAEKERKHRERMRTAEDASRERIRRKEKEHHERVKRQEESNARYKHLKPSPRQNLASQKLIARYASQPKHHKSQFSKQSSPRQPERTESSLSHIFNKIENNMKADESLVNLGEDEQNQDLQDAKSKNNIASFDSVMGESAVE